jgi:hypothetical protein
MVLVLLRGGAQSGARCEHCKYQTRGGGGAAPGKLANQALAEADNLLLLPLELGLGDKLVGVADEGERKLLQRMRSVWRDHRALFEETQHGGEVDRVDLQRSTTWLKVLTARY